MNSSKKQNIHWYCFCKQIMKGCNGRYKCFLFWNQQPQFPVVVSTLTHKPRWLSGSLHLCWSRRDKAAPRRIVGQTRLKQTHSLFVCFFFLTFHHLHRAATRWVSVLHLYLYQQFNYNLVCVSKCKRIYFCLFSVCCFNIDKIFNIYLYSMCLALYTF